jgi:cadmium resistance protein CadD (predicted permease)
LLVAVFLAFAAAAVDNLIIVTALFTSSRATGRPRPGSIVAGQYIGFAAIVGTSLVAAAGLRAIPDRWVGLVGFIPIAVGVRELWRLRGNDDDSRPPLASTVAAIAMVTFTNGADDIGVYAPLFRSLQVIPGLLVAAEFLLLIGLWCAVGALLGTHRVVVATLGRTSNWLVPLVFISIGIVILANGARTLTADAL